MALTYDQALPDQLGQQLAGGQGGAMAAAVAMVPPRCTSLPSHRTVPVYSVTGRTKLTLILAWCRRHLRAGCCGSLKGVLLALGASVRREVVVYRGLTTRGLQITSASPNRGRQTHVWALHSPIFLQTRLDKAATAASADAKALD